MGNLVFQATLGGQVSLVGPNTASTFTLNVPAVSSTLATLTGTETLTNKTLTTPTISLLSSASATALTLQSAGTTAVTIDTSQNATFAKSIILSGSTSGTTTLASTAVAGTSTATFPAATGTVMVSGNMPTFSAYASVNGSAVSANTLTKVLFDTKLWDTNTNFASSRFTPTVAGYYQVNSTVQYGSAFSGFLAIYKTGSIYKRGAWIIASACNELSVSGIVYCNGSSDYIEIYGYQSIASNIPQGGFDITWFDACLIRSA
jgi:hypothetical protein